MPLQIIFDIFERKNFVIAWDYFVRDALKSGWRYAKIKAMTHEVFVDSYSMDEVKELDEKIDVSIFNYAM